MKNVFWKDLDLDVEVDQLEDLKKQIESSFKERSLYKGVSQLICSVDERKPITRIFLVGDLDSWYLQSIYDSLKDTGLIQKIPVFKIHTKWRRLIYDVIKDINLKNVPRTESRRFFLCRAFSL